VLAEDNGFRRQLIDQARHTLILALSSPQPIGPRAACSKRSVRPRPPAGRSRAAAISRL